jgi:hypothetical protein
MTSAHHAFRGITDPLWPIRYKPLDDELLSCWLVRLAHGHGLKVQTFCNLLFGNSLQVWNRDIDRLAPEWLVKELVAGTGTSVERAMGTTLRVFHGLLYPKFKESGNLQWLLALMIFHRRRQGFGQQYCPECLAADTLPYFRKTWRVALKTICAEHGCMLRDRCESCGEPVSFFRMDMGRPDVPEVGAVVACFNCRFDLRSATGQSIDEVDSEAIQWLNRLVCEIDEASAGRGQQFPVDEVNVLYRLMRLLLTSRETVRLRPYLADCLGIKPIPLPAGKRVAFESLPLDLRHELLTLGAWVMVDPLGRLKDAVAARAIRYNHLVRDFESAPEWFATVATNALRRKLPSR